MRASDPSVFDVIMHAPLPRPAAEVVALLAPYVTEHRLRRIEEVAATRTLSVTPVLENIADPHNASAILRSADAFGIHRVHVVADLRTLRAAHKVARGSDRWLELIRYDDSASCVSALRSAGYEVFVASMDGEHRPEDLAGRPKVAAVFGNEHRGVSPEVRAAADGTFSIPMRGFVESLNVSVAAAITLYLLGRDAPSRANEAERSEIVARLLMATVNDASRILSNVGRTRGPSSRV